MADDLHAWALHRTTWLLPLQSELSLEEYLPATAAGPHRWRRWLMEATSQVCASLPRRQLLRRRTCDPEYYGPAT